VKSESAVIGSKTGGVVGWNQVPVLGGHPVTFISMVITRAQDWLSIIFGQLYFNCFLA
jgi:hypothetical protein